MSVGAGTSPPRVRLPRVVQGALYALSYERFSAWLHARYGSTVTLRVFGFPTIVLTADRDVIGSLFTGDPLAKRHGNDALGPLVGKGSVMVLEPAQHLIRRKLLLPPFHGQRLAVYGELMERLVEDELARWHVGETVVVHPRAQALTLEVILQAVLGISDSAVRDRVGTIFEAMLEPGTMLGLSIATTSGQRLSRLARRYYALKSGLDVLLRAHVAATREDPALEDRDDVLSMLVQARDEDGAGLTDEELRDELMTLIAAGYETTATAIAWGVDLLSHNPQVLKRARRAAIDGDDVYLDAVIKEVLRIRPPVPVAAARYPLQPLAVGDWTVEPGHLILIDAQAIHHDPTLYPDPESFQPDRFLEHPPQGYAFIPFGGGTHRCLGAALAQLEMRIVLRAILTRFELAPAHPQLERSRRRSTTLSPRRGTRIRIIRELRHATPAPVASAPRPGEVGNRAV